MVDVQTSASIPSTWTRPVLRRGRPQTVSDPGSKVLLLGRRLQPEFGDIVACGFNDTACFDFAGQVSWSQSTSGVAKADQPVLRIVVHRHSQFATSNS